MMAGFIQGDVSELVVEQRRANDLAQRRYDQAEVHTRKLKGAYVDGMRQL